MNQTFVLVSCMNMRKVKSYLCGAIMDGFRAIMRAMRKQLIGHVTSIIATSQLIRRIKIKTAKKSFQRKTKRP